jgi:hypothetical protein
VAPQPTETSHEGTGTDDESQPADDGHDDQHGDDPHGEHAVQDAQS